MGHFCSWFSGRPELVRSLVYFMAKLKAVWPMVRVMSAPLLKPKAVHC